MLYIIKFKRIFKKKLSHIEKILCYAFKLKYLNKKNYPTLKKYNFFLVNVEYIYIYILKDFKSHIEKILCYPFKLKYLNQKVFLSHVEKT